MSNGAFEKIWGRSFRGSDILPPNATKLERVFMDALGNVINTEFPNRVLWDPDKAPTNFLDALAWGFSPDIWDPNWTTQKKRELIARALEDHRLKGTEAGINRHLEIVGATILQTVTMPQGFFASPELTKEEWDAYIAQHPRVRITLNKGRGEWDYGLGFFLDACALDADALDFDRGRALYGRKAFLVKPGELPIPLQTTTVTTTSSLREGVVTEQVVTPGYAVGSTILDDWFLDDRGFLGAWDVQTAFYTYELRQSYLHQESTLALQTVPVGTQPRDVRYFRESEKGEAGPSFFMDGGFLGEGFATLDRADELIADVIYLHDPAIAVPQTVGMSFLNYTRIGMGHHRADILIDARTTLPEHTGFVLGLSYIDEDPAAPVDNRRRTEVLDAVSCSKRLSDKVAVTFQTRRPRTLGDGIRLDGKNTLGSTVQANL